MKGDLYMFVVDFEYYDEMSEQYEPDIQYVCAESAQKAVDEVRSWFDKVKIDSVYKEFKGWK